MAQLTPVIAKQVTTTTYRPPAASPPTSGGGGLAELLLIGGLVLGGYEVYSHERAVQTAKAASPPATSQPSKTAPPAAIQPGLANVPTATVSSPSASGVTTVPVQPTAPSSSLGVPASTIRQGSQLVSYTGTALPSGVPQPSTASQASQALVALSTLYLRYQSQHPNALSTSDPYLAELHAEANSIRQQFPGAGPAGGYTAAELGGEGAVPAAAATAAQPAPAAAVTAAPAASTAAAPSGVPTPYPWPASLAAAKTALQQIDAQYFVAQNVGDSSLMDQFHLEAQAVRAAYPTAGPAGGYTAAQLVSLGLLPRTFLPAGTATAASTQAAQQLQQSNIQVVRQRAAQTAAATAAAFGVSQAPAAVSTAAPGSVTGVQQTASTPTSVTLSWSPAPNAYSYDVSGQGFAAQNPTQPAVTITGLRPRSSYQVNITPVSGGGRGPTATVTVQTSAPAQAAAARVTAATVNGQAEQPGGYSAIAGLWQPGVNGAPSAVTVGLTNTGGTPAVLAVRGDLWRPWGFAGFQPFVAYGGLAGPYADIQGRASGLLVGTGGQRGLLLEGHAVGQTSGPVDPGDTATASLTLSWANAIDQSLIPTNPRYSGTFGPSRDAYLISLQAGALDSAGNFTPSGSIVVLAGDLNYINQVGS
jgi:hypothetical protein